MITVGIITSYESGKITAKTQQFKNLSDAKRFTTSYNERNRCDRLGIMENSFKFHDTEKRKSWSVYGIGVSKHDYISETEEEFIRRIFNMALPTYDKSKRTKQFKALPKGAYVIKILSAKEVQNSNNNGSHLAFAFDIAEGEYKDFYNKQFQENPNEDKKWPNDAIYRLGVPNDQSQPFVWSNWNTFFADLEDSNNGFVFSGDPKTLKGKLIGGKFHIEQNEYRGNIYDHTRLRWTCVAEDVRSGNPGRMPNDKLVTKIPTKAPADEDDFVKIPNGLEEEVPFL